MQKQLYRLLFFLLLTAGCTQEPDWSYENTPRGNVEALWDIIDKRYCFVEEKSVDWEDLRDVYLDRADTVSDEWSLFDLMAEMLDHLQDGHVNLYSDFNVSRCRGWYESYPEIYDEAMVYGDKYLTKDYKIAGGLQYNIIDEGRIGLIRYPSFSSGFGVMNMLYVLQCFKDCRGIVLDVRHNGGGSLEYAKDLASTFFKEPRQVGWWNHKTGEGHYDLSEMEKMSVDTTKYAQVRWLRPVVVICDRRSYSATNFFVNAMRHADNCVIIGQRTGGGGGMPLSYELPCGWMVRFSSVKMYDIDKGSIEDGVMPDGEIKTKGVGKDQAIDTAVKIINDAYDKSK